MLKKPLGLVIFAVCATLQAADAPGRVILRIKNGLAPYQLSASSS